MNAVTSDPTPLPAKKPRKANVKITAELEALMIKFASEGNKVAEVARLTNVSYGAAWKCLSQPAAKARIAQSVIKQAVDKQALRERQKETLARRLEAMTEKVCDLVENKVREGDAKEFAHATQGLERLDKVSGNTVGEGTRVIHEGLPTEPPQVQLQVLIQQVLAK